MLQKCKNCKKLQGHSDNAKLPSPRKSQLSRDLSRKNDKPAVKFAASQLRGLLYPSQSRGHFRKCDVMYRRVGN